MVESAFSDGCVLCHNMMAQYERASMSFCCHASKMSLLGCTLRLQLSKKNHLKTFTAQQPAVDVLPDL
jgi:hypothetical protein